MHCTTFWGFMETCSEYVQFLKMESNIGDLTVCQHTILNLSEIIAFERRCDVTIVTLDHQRVRNQQGAYRVSEGKSSQMTLFVLPIM